MFKKLLVILFAGIVSVNAFADGGLLNNVSLQNACNINYIGVSSGATDMVPLFELDVYVCERGYYLPADGTECEICPNNNYCVGGAFSYNATKAQGIRECPNSWYSPAGMWELASCGRIFHVGNDVIYLRNTKRTTPSMNFDIGRDGTPDFFANMTTIRTKMNKDSDRYFHVDWGDNRYYLCDDTTCPETE